MQGQEFGLGVYNKALKYNDSTLYDKKQESEKAAVELNDFTKTEEEKQIIRARKENLDEEIARMESRRNRMRNYTEDIESSSDVGKYIDKKTQIKRDEKIKAEVDRRIQKRNELGLKVDEEEKKQIEIEVKKQVNRQIKKRKIYRDEKTGQKELISSVGMQYKRDINKAIWGNDAVKSATKNMVKNSTDKIVGNAMIFAAIPLTVANPKVGLALLGKGMHNTKSSNEFRKIATYGERKRLVKYKKVTLQKEKNKKYTFNRFNKPALQSIQAKQRMKQEANIVRKINSPSVAMKAFSLPLRMIGVSGAVRSAMSYQYKVDKAKRKYYQNEEASYAVATKDSVNKDFKRDYDNLIYSMESKYSNMTFEEAVLENKKATGQVYEVNNIKFEFIPYKNESENTSVDLIFIDNAILNVAAKNNIIDLNEVSFSNNDEHRKEIIEELAEVGIITNLEFLNLDKPNKELVSVFEMLEDRKELLEKKSPESAKEKLIQIVTSEYMKENNIESAEEVKNEVHTQKIKEIVFDRISSNMPKIEEKTIENKTEEAFYENVETIVKAAMETTNDEKEIRKILIEKTEELVQEEKEEPIAPNVESLLESLNSRKDKILVESNIKESNIFKNLKYIEEDYKNTLDDKTIITSNERVEKINKPEETHVEENFFFKPKLTQESKQEGFIFEEKTSGEENKDLMFETRTIEKEENKDLTFESKSTEEENKDLMFDINSIKPKKDDLTFESKSIEEKDDFKIIEEVTEEDLIRKQKTKEVLETLDIHEIISTIKKKDEEEKETIKFESFIEDVVSSVQEIESVPTFTKQEEKIKESPEEVEKFVRDIAKKKVRKSQEYKDLNEELRKFDSRKKIDEMTDEYIEKNSSGKYDGLISNLIASMYEDKVLVDIKVTKPTDKRVLTMQYIDEQRETNTYNKTNIEDIIKIMESKKATNNKERTSKND